MTSPNLATPWSHDDPWAGADVLAGVSWECAATPPGTLAGPADLEAVPTWWSAQVPGTAAAALAAAGAPGHDQRDYDAEDWWFRTRFHAPAGLWRLRADGLATIADIWVDGHHVLRSENMFRASSLDVQLHGEHHELVVGCSALNAVLAERRPRPRWKTYLVRHQNLRWIRTSLLGRIPGWASIPATVGPWRPISLFPASDIEPEGIHLLSRCDGAGGVINVSFRLPHGVLPTDGEVATTVTTVAVSDRGAPQAGPIGRTELAAHREDRVTVFTGRLHLPAVRRWWPHTHGDQPLYDVTAELGTEVVKLGHVGFRTISVDDRDGGFRVMVNGEPIFCRGACWFPPDPALPHTPQEETARTLDLARQAHCNMVRVPGTSVYQDRSFFDQCDELGLLVWHDCMFAFMDPPEDENFVAEVTGELNEALITMSGHPSLAVICGSQEVQEVAAMNGLAADRCAVPLLEKTIPRIVDEMVPDVAYVSSNPSGGALPFQMDTGVCQYFGVGGYLRPVEDARRSGVRFAAECLALATPPERHVVDDHCGGATAAGHDPTWKRGLHHDAGRSWDMEDVRDFYVHQLFDVDPLRLRYEDPERALDLGRATNAHLVSTVLSEWRRPGSSCSGALILALRDLRDGAGWGLIDFQGNPKAPWFALRRVSAPLALLVTDEGLNGLHCHVLNDTACTWHGRLRVELLAQGALVTGEGSLPVEVGPRQAVTLDAGSALEGFRDITYAYRFAPPGHDAVVLTLLDHAGVTVADAVHLPLGQARSVEPDVGLEATASSLGDGTWSLEVRSERLAQWVSIDAPGFLPEDSWFHLAPRRTRMLRLRHLPAGRGAPEPALRGRVRALNSVTDARIRVNEPTPSDSIE